MKKLLFLAAVVLMMVVGCLPTTTTVTTNEPPSAYIDSVSPAQISPGEAVTFSGHGIDPDGSVAAYRWRSSIDGEISTAASFETLSLSEGSHTVWFRVQDDSGDWSEEVPCHVTVLPTGIVLPTIDLFESNPSSIAEGESSTLNWSASDASKVSIDQEIGSVALSGNRVVSPSATTVYTLTASNETGSVIATAEVAIAAVPTHVVEVYSIAAEDGHVRRDAYVGQETNVGDTPSGVAMQAFLSFDISMIPVGTHIKSASLDLTTADIFGSPYSNLGRLYIYSCQYSKLSAADFFIGIPTGALATASRIPTKPFSSSLLTDAVQTQVDAGRQRFQVRLQFEKYSFYNREADYLAFAEAKPKLVIEYQY